VPTLLGITVVVNPNFHVIKFGANLTHVIVAPMALRSSHCRASSMQLFDIGIRFARQYNMLTVPRGMNAGTMPEECVCFVNMITQCREH
jgi:hypothetical protein